MPFIPSPGGGSSFPDYDSTTTPATPSSGEFWWDRNVHVLKRYNGTSWDWVGLDDLANVDTSGKADADGIAWDTDGDPDAWIPATIGGGGTPSAHGCRVTTASATSMTNNAETPLAFGSESDDTDGYHDNTTNNTRVTIPTGLGGVYSIAGQVQFAQATGGSRYCRLHVNGVGSDFGTTMGGISTVGAHVAYAAHRRLAAGDYIELVGWQNSGVALNGNGYLTAYLIGT